MPKAAMDLIVVLTAVPGHHLSQDVVAWRKVPAMIPGLGDWVLLVQDTPDGLDFFYMSAAVCER